MRLPASASLPLASCWPLPQQLLPASATGGGRRRCSQRERLWRTRRRKKAPLEVATPRGFFLFGVTILTFDIPDFSIPDSPQKSSAVQKVYSHSSPDIYCIFLAKFMVYLFCGLARPFLLKEPGLRLPASASLPLASCWPRPQQLLPVSATGGGRRRCKWLDGWFTGRKH